MEYNPIQLNTNVSYQESFAAKGLRDKIAFYWELKTNECNLEYSIIPDGCVDIIMNCSNNVLYVSPTLIEAGYFNLSKNETWFGIRFYPGVLANLLRSNLSELQFDTIELEKINKNLEKQLKENLIMSISFEQRVEVVNQFFLQKNFQVNHNILETLNTIYKTKGAILLKGNDRKVFSVSKRHLRRLFHQEVGVSPKMFARIMRNQFLLNEFKKNKKSKIYYDLYFDQSHMIKEMKHLTGFTPKQIIAQL